MSTSRQSGRSRRTTSTPSRPAAPATPAETSTLPPANGADNQSWVHDYNYVFRDLRKLAIVSLSLFAIIIISGFFF
jgi:hypothetical protein